MTLMEALLLGGAAFFAGVMNTLAGGGTFLTFPALVFAGVPPVAANATSAVAVFPGYLGGAAGFRDEITAFNRITLLRLLAVTVLSGGLGSALLLVSSDAAFSAVVPALLAIATLLFAFGGRLRDWVETGHSHRPSLTPLVSLASFYGGYFNGGLGIMLLAVFGLGGLSDLNQMNGLKNLLSFVLSAVSVVAFSLAGLVAWPHALLMMVMAAIGGYLGAPLARRLPATWIRGFVVLVGTAMTLGFAWRLF